MTGEDEPVTVDTAGGIAWVTLNRPDRLNAMDDALMDSLRQKLHVAAVEPEVRCVVLRGAGRSFCSGGDIQMMARRRAEQDLAASVGRRMEDRTRRLVKRAECSHLLSTMPKPTVAVLHGHVVGGGLGLALAADLRIAAADTKLRVGFAARGLSGDFGVSVLLERIVGTAKARELMLLDPVLDSSTAHSTGLVTMVCSPESLDARVREVADQLAAGPTIAFGRMKDNLAASHAVSMHGAMHTEALNQMVAAETADARESADAYLQGRPPAFLGT